MSDTEEQSGTCTSDIEQMSVDDVPGWKCDVDGVWHATTGFDGYQFDALCGDVVERSGVGTWRATRPRGPAVDVCDDCDRYVHTGTEQLEADSQ